jgi:hypothetical protein
VPGPWNTAEREAGEDMPRKPGTEHPGTNYDHAGGKTNKTWKVSAAEGGSDRRPPCRVQLTSAWANAATRCRPPPRTAQLWSGGPCSAPAE